MVTRLSSLWDVYFKASIPRERYERTLQKCPKRQIRADRQTIRENTEQNDHWYVAVGCKWPAHLSRPAQQRRTQTSSLIAEHWLKLRLSTASERENPPRHQEKVWAWRVARSTPRHDLFAEATIKLEQSPPNVELLKRATEVGKQTKLAKDEVEWQWRKPASNPKERA